MYVYIRFSNLFISVKLNSSFIALVDLIIFLVINQQISIRMKQIFLVVKKALFLQFFFFFFFEYM